MSNRLPKNGEFEITESIPLSDIEYPITESDDPADKRMVRVTIFSEGEGNAKDSRYYTKPAIHKARELALKARKMWDGHVSGAKGAESRRLRSDWLGSIKEAEVVDDGIAKLRAKVWIADSGFYEKLKNAGDDVSVSIDAIGRGKQGKIPGKEKPYTVIEDVVWVNSFDFVSAGGNVKDAQLELTEAEVEPEDKDKKESDNNEMNYEEITMSTLRENRGDLVEAIERMAMDRIEKDQESAVTLAERDAEIARLKEENQAQKLKLDENEVKERQRTEKETRDKLIAEADLPEEQMTETFKEILEGQTDPEKIKALLEDRKAAFAKTDAGVKDSGNETKVEEEEKDARPWLRSDPWKLKEEEQQKKDEKSDE